MRYYVYALTNDVAQLLVKDMSTSDLFTFEMIVNMWKGEGFIVNTRIET